MAAIPKCTYGGGCDRDINGRSTLCEFHAPVDRKTLTIERFNEAVFALIEAIRNEPTEAQFNFEGFIFPGAIAFTGAFAHPVYFDKALFADDVSFWMVTFEKYAQFEETRFNGNANFRKSVFLEPDFCAYFFGARFKQGADFWSARFHGGVSFSQSIFGGDKTDFASVACMSGPVYFHDAALYSHFTDFLQANFNGGIEFISTRFGAGETWFNSTRFGDVLFSGCGVAGTITFNDSLIEGKNSFIFQGPRFIRSTACVIFERFVFSPSRTFFDQVPDARWYLQHREELEDLSRCAEWPALIFRFCQLSDAHFSRCSMGLISFLTSSFSQARFNECRWLQDTEHVLYSFTYRRMNILIEEVWYELRRKLIGSDEERRRIGWLSQDLRIPQQIAEMYRQMKAALDGAQDFSQSGHFYFNECEMRRLGYREAFHPINRHMHWIVRRLSLGRAVLKPGSYHDKSRWLAFSIYHRVAGYGERPMFAFGWFIFFTIFFAMLHMLHGYRYLKSDVVNYQFDPSPRGLANMIDLSFLGELFGNLGGAIVLTLYRIIPGGYLPKEMSEHSPYNVQSPFEDPWGLSLLVANSAVLLLLIAFIIAGTQRHFKRA